MISAGTILQSSLSKSDDDEKQLAVLDDVWEEEPTRDGNDGTGPKPSEDDEEDTEEPPPGSEDGKPDPPKNREKDIYTPSLLRS